MFHCILMSRWKLPFQRNEPSQFPGWSLTWRCSWFLCVGPSPHLALDKHWKTANGQAESHSDQVVRPRSVSDLHMALLRAGQAFNFGAYSFGAAYLLVVAIQSCFCISMPLLSSPPETHQDRRVIRSTIRLPRLRRSRPGKRVSACTSSALHSSPIGTTATEEKSK